MFYSLLLCFFSPDLLFFTTVVQQESFQSKLISMLHAKAHTVTWVTAEASWKELQPPCNTQGKDISLQTPEMSFRNSEDDGDRGADPHRASELIYSETKREVIVLESGPDVEHVTSWPVGSDGGRRCSTEK